MTARIVAFLLAGAAAAAAQTSPGLVLRPFEEGRRAELSLEVEHYLDGRTDAGSAMDLGVYRTRGRFRFSESRRSAAVGFDALWLELSSDDPRLPDRLTDQSVAVGMGVGKWGDWILNATLGGGFAGDSPYSDSRAWYALASLSGVYRAERTMWTVTLDWNGNRAIFPDAPLPAFSYTRFVSPKLRYSLGFPFSRLDWSPSERWELELSWVIVNVRARVAFRPAPRWELFAAFAGLRGGFHVDGDREHERILYEQRRVEAGIGWEPRPGLAVRIGAGYAFDQRFSKGFDVRSTDTLARLDDEAFVFVRLEVSF